MSELVEACSVTEVPGCSVADPIFIGCGRGEWVGMGVERRNHMRNEIVSGWEHGYDQVGMATVLRSCITGSYLYYRY